MRRALARAAVVLATQMLVVVPVTAKRTAEVRVPIEIQANRSATTVVVEEGDHLWKISERHVASGTDGEPDTGLITYYWRLVIEANVDRLRSGDPDLIYPGEVIELPAPGVSGQP